MSKFGTALGNTLFDLNLSQQDLAEKVDVTQPWINALINTDRAPTSQLLGKIYKALTEYSQPKAAAVVAAALCDHRDTAGLDTTHLMIDIPHLCGLCDHFHANLSDPSTGACKINRIPVDATDTCHCFKPADLDK